MSPVLFRKKHHITSINFNGHSANIAFHDPNPEEHAAERSTHIHLTNCPALEYAVEQIMANAKKEELRINDRGFTGRIQEIELPLPNAVQKSPGGKAVVQENKREKILGEHLGRIGTLPIREIYYDKPQHTISLRLPTEPISPFHKLAVLKGLQELDNKAIAPATMAAARDFIFKDIQEAYAEHVRDPKKTTIEHDYVDISALGSKFTDFRIEIRPSHAQAGKLMVKLNAAQMHYRANGATQRIEDAEAHMDEIIKHLKASGIKNATRYPIEESVRKSEWDRYSTNGGGSVLVGETSMRDLVKALATPLKDKEGSNVIPECFGDKDILEQLDDEAPSLETEVEEVVEQDEPETAPAEDDKGEGAHAKKARGSKAKTVIKSTKPIKKAKIVAKGGAAKKTSKRR